MPVGQIKAVKPNGSAFLVQCNRCGDCSWINIASVSKFLSAPDHKKVRKDNRKEE